MNQKEESIYDKKDAVETDVQEVVAEADAYYIDPVIQKRLVRKLDIRLLPCCFFLYFFSALDRGNLGNAKSAGLEKDLGFKANEYGILLTCFTLSFSLLSVPGTMLTARIGPNITLPLYMAVWGALCAVGAACKSFGSLTAVRLLLGALEAGFAPSMILMLTLYYTRGELALRICAFYSCLALSGAFSGLLSFGIFQIESSKLHGWQILFILEGCLTVVVALICGYFLPPPPNKCTFLTEEEKEVARMRMLQDGSSNPDEKYSHKAFFASLKEPTFYVYSLIALCYGVGSATASNFLPQIVGRMGFSTVKTNLYTVAPNMLSAVLLLVTAISSDRLRERSFHLISALSLTFIGCLILTGTPSIPVSYMATFFIAGGAFTPSVIFHTWHNNNATNVHSRAFRTGFLTFCANISGVVSANIFRTQDAPAYIPALATTAAFEGTAICAILALRSWFAFDNRRRNKAQGVNWTSKDVPTSVLAKGPKDPKFRHFC